MAENEVPAVLHSIASEPRITTTVRLGVDMRERIKARAAVKGISFNAYIERAIIHALDLGERDAAEPEYVVVRVPLSKVF
jgi:hypothetical protein